MELKVFRLENGKLRYLGIREVREGDIILDGDTSMAETVHLRESWDLNAEILRDLPPEKKEAFRAGLRSLGMPDPGERAALRTVFKDIFVAQGLPEEHADRAADVASKGRGR